MRGGEREGRLRPRRGPSADSSDCSSCRSSSSDSAASCPIACLEERGSSNLPPVLFLLALGRRVALPLLLFLRLDLAASLLGGPRLNLLDKEDEGTLEVRDFLFFFCFLRSLSFSSSPLALELLCRGFSRLLVFFSRPDAFFGWRLLRRVPLSLFFDGGAMGGCGATVSACSVETSLGLSSSSDVSCSAAMGSSVLSQR